jgi:drug/metabolite transporter (DMT)-like permease
MSSSSWFLMMVFMASGIATPLLIGLLHRQGACGQETMFSVFPNYAIMIFTVCGDWQSRHRGIVRWRSVAMATVVDAVSQGANYTGLIQAGSSYYVLIYSSVTVWVAIFSRVLLNRSHTSAQWGGCVLVSIGVAVTGLSAGQAGRDVASGILLVILGSIGHSLAYVLMEWNTAVAPHPIAPSLLATLMGAGAALLYSVYEATYVMPRWKTLVTDAVHDAGGDAATIAIGYFALLCAFWWHAFSFYALMTRLGATAAGVCKGLQAVGVLVASHALFCQAGGSPEAQAQCFNASKALAFVIVSAGVGLFSLTPAQ